MSEQHIFYSDLLIIIGKVVTGSSFLPIVIAIWKKNSFIKPIKLIAIYLLALIGSNLIEQAFIWSSGEHYYIFWKPILDTLQITNTNFLNIIGRLIDYIFVGWIFSFGFKPPLDKQIKQISWGLIPLAILVYFFVDGFRTYGTVNAILNRTYLVAVPVLYFWNLFNSSPHLSLWRNPFFLFGLGLFLPNLVGLMMSFIGDKLNETDYVAFVKISIFRNCLTILAQFLFAYAFYQARYAKYLVKVQ